MSRLTRKNESICDYCEYERNNGCIKTDPAKCVFSRTWNELQHCKDLEEQGRLIELPCKVGDMVWIIGHNEMHFWNGEPEYIIGKSEFSLSCLGQMGQRIFLTKEEAEAKLEELKEGAK